MTLKMSLHAMSLVKKCLKKATYAYKSGCRLVGERYSCMSMVSSLNVKFVDSNLDPKCHSYHFIITTTTIIIIRPDAYPIDPYAKY